MDNDLNLPDLDHAAQPSSLAGRDDIISARSPKTVSDLEQVLDVPVNVTAVLGKTRMEVAQLLKIGPGQLLELDRRVGEAIDIYVNNRLVARGEVVVIEDKLGVTMTEIIKTDR
jgi:flagellar motor switch protein FliN/FliY